MDRIKAAINYKEEIKAVLSNLKTLGFDRRAVEKGLGCREFYVDQVLSKGGNKVFLASVKRFYEAKKTDATNANRAHLEDIVIALQATVHVLNLRVLELESLVTKKSKLTVSAEVEKKTQQQLERLLLGRTG